MTYKNGNTLSGMSFRDPSQMDLYALCLPVCTDEIQGVL